MFNNLINKLSKTLCNISNCGRLTESNINNTLREVRIALLEADVTLSVVKKFINNVKEISINKSINKSLTPGQEFIKIVYNQLVLSLGEKNAVLNLSISPPVIILIAGLQGAGKTTSIVKLGRFLHQKYKKKILTVSTDIYRHAAIKQLELLSTQAEIDFYPSNINQKPADIAISALKQAKLNFYDVLLVDTAGRLHINTIMMNEIKKLHEILNPIETLFVVDAMTGQDAVNTAKIFNESLSITGIILTKVDGDCRGGAALSMCSITGKPIKFIGTGEKLVDLEIFYPERIASRILGMGDVLSLIEEIENKVCINQAEKLKKQLNKNNDFNLIDFLEQLKQMRNIGGINSIIDKLPIISKFSENKKMLLNIDDKFFIHMEAMINSMTIEERKKPSIIKGSRKRRIAFGSGTKVQDVNRLLKQFSDMQNMIKKIKKNDISKIMSNIKNLMLPNALRKN